MTMLLSRLVDKILGVTIHDSPAAPDTCLRPSVNTRIQGMRPPNDIIMDSSTTLAVLCLGDQQFQKTGRWILTEQDQEYLLGKIDGDCGEDNCVDGKLTKSELEDFMASEQNRQMLISDFPSSAHGLTSKDLIQVAFLNFDTDGDGTLDASEWKSFLDFFAQLRLRYLQQIAFVQRRAYFGRGQSQNWSRVHPAGHDATMTKVSSTDIQNSVRKLAQSKSMSNLTQSEFGPAFRFGSLVRDWRGWRYDLYYFSANVHALHGIFCCDPIHPLNRFERIMMEFTTLVYNYWQAHEYQIFKGRGGVLPLVPDMAEQRIWRWLFITLPSCLVHALLVYCFTTPHGGTVDTSAASQSEIAKARTIQRIGEAMGNAISLGIIFSAFCRVSFYSPRSFDDPSMWGEMIYTRSCAWMLAWLVMIFFKFNPFFAWGTTSPNDERTIARLGDLVRLGRWTIEYERVEKACRVLQPVLVKPTALRMSAASDDHLPGNQTTLPDDSDPTDVPVIISPTILPEDSLPTFVPVIMDTCDTERSPGNIQVEDLA